MSVEPGGQQRRIVLQDDWAATEICAGKIVSNIENTYVTSIPS